MTDSDAESAPPIDWEAFYQSYRKPGYVPGYEITSKLGGGMFGLVFKATKQSIGKDYAIKFLKVDDEDVRRAVVAELESAPFFAQVDHPNLVSIEDRGVVDGIPFIVMAYAGDETLRDRLGSAAGDIEALLRVYLQACRGVQALHEHSLVHFDLKPANIFLKGDVARIGDYGLSKLVAQSRNTLSMGRGTPYYMAPEMLQRKGDARSDVYSLGVILFELLTGDVPFKGDSEWEVLRKHETATPDYPADMPREFRSVLSRALAKDPNDRFQSAAELVVALCESAGAAPNPAEDGVGSAPPPRFEHAASAEDGDNEDPYVEFRKVCREFADQAKQMASEAFKNVRAASREASRDARATLGPAMRRHRRVWTARMREQRRRCEDWFEKHRDWSDWRRRSRPKRSRSAARVAVPVLIVLLGFAFFGAFTLKSFRSSPSVSITTSERTASVGDTAHMSMTQDAHVEASTGEGSARDALADARMRSPEALHSTLKEFRSHVPSSPETLKVTKAKLPDYPLAINVSTKTLKKARSEARRLAFDGKASSKAKLESYGYAGVLAAVDTLGDLDMTDKRHAKAAKRLNDFLANELKFHSIVVNPATAGRPGDRYEKLNEAAPQLWRWFVHDFVWDQRRFDEYRRATR